MRFSLKETECRIMNVNSRAETHGDQRKPAADVKLKCMLPNAELKQFDKALVDLFYEKATKGQADMHSATQLRYPQLKTPIGWEDEVIGGELTVHRGISSKSNIEIKGCIINGFTIEPIEGGSIGVIFTAKFHPESEDQIGKLCMLNGQDVIVSVVSPTQREQEKQRSLLDEDEKEPA
jgi:hypothetical protein